MWHTLAPGLLAEKPQEEKAEEHFLLLLQQNLLHVSALFDQNLAFKHQHVNKRSKNHQTASS